MANMADIMFDLGGDSAKNKDNEAEFEIDLCNDLLADDLPPPVSESVELLDNYQPPVYTVQGTAVTTTKTTVAYDDTLQSPEDDFDFDLPSINQVPKIQNDDDDEFDFDVGVAKNTKTVVETSSMSTTATSRANVYTASSMYSSSTVTQTSMVKTTSTTIKSTSATVKSSGMYDVADDSDSDSSMKQSVENSVENSTGNSTETSPPSMDSVDASAIADDVDVRVSFQHVASPQQQNINVSGNLFSGLNTTCIKKEQQQKDVYSPPKQPVDIFAVNIMKEEQLDGFSIPSTRKEPPQIPAQNVTTEKQREGPAAKYEISLEDTGGIHPTNATAKPESPAAPMYQQQQQEEDSSDEEENEWSKVREIVPEMADGQVKPRAESAPFITYNDAMDHFLRGDLTQYKPQIKTSVHHSGFGAFKHLLFGPPKLHKNLIEARDQAFCLAICQLENSDPLHIRMLQTLNKKLTGSKFDCPRFGSHWENIGFQGNDPATDLRGCGMLGLVQLLYLVSSPSTAKLAADIYKLSTHEVQNFPFCIMGINMTRIVILALREEGLNKELNKRNNVFGLLNDFYVSIYYHLYHVWKTQQKTIAHTGFVIRDLETLARKKPQQLLKALETYQAQQKSSANAVEVDDEPIKFSKFD